MVLFLVDGGGYDEDGRERDTPPPDKGPRIFTKPKPGRNEGRSEANPLKSKGC